VNDRQRICLGVLGGALLFSAAAPAADVAVNFQLADPGDGGLPAGYLIDTGAVFADRGNGHSYGWNTNTNSQARNRVVGGQSANANGDERLDTLIHLNPGSTPGTSNGSGPFTWELLVPNGEYEVLSIWGDPDNVNSWHNFLLEGTSVTDPTPGVGNHETYTNIVNVQDGRLTIAGVLSTNAKIAYVEVTAVPEPAAVSVLGVAVVGLLGRRRRRRA